jgi:NitT/TauT family transport system substrate-binding protein
LGEPAVTNAIAPIGTGAQVVLDLQTEWSDLTGLEGGYPQASLVVRTAFLDSNKAFVDELISKLGTLSTWIEAEGNLAVAKTAIQAKAEGTTLSNITLDTVSRCGVNTVAASVAKSAVTEYLAVFNITVDNNFYYEG